MNKSAIEWCHYTWNPITGCLHGCPYCYARKIATRFKGTKAWPNGFEPTWHPERLPQPAKVAKPSRVFVGSVTDLFGDWVDLNWILEVLCMMTKCDWHKYLILTKNPRNIGRLLYDSHIFGEGDFMDNVWLGTSVTCQDDVNRIETLKKHAWAWHKFVSFEPLLGPIECDLEGIEWIIIGAQTNPSLHPNRAWIKDLISAAEEQGIPVFMKDNLGSLLPESLRHQYPEELKVQP